MTHTVAAHVASHAQAWWNTRIDAARDGQRGQGTVEYVGIVVTVALLLSAVAVASKGWGNDVGNALKNVIKSSIDLVANPKGR